MFDFAISRNERRAPSWRFYASWIASILVHNVLLVLLIQYPQVLHGGVYSHFRAIWGSSSDDDDENWRTVTILNPSKMVAPSPAALKKLLADLNKNGSSPPPIRISWDGIKAAQLDKPPMPRIQQNAKDPKLSLPPNELASGGSAAESAPGTGESAAGSSAGNQSASNGSGQGSIGLPSPGSGSKPVAADNTAAPSKIPNSIKPPDPPSASSAKVRVFEDEEKAIRSAEGGFFDTLGFPMGEYANLINEKIMNKWLIPSNLRGSQGQTTVIFYIDKSGRAMNAHIVTGSGSNSLDLAALTAILQSDPFPALPKGFPGDRVGAKFVFSYNEPQR